MLVSEMSYMQLYELLGHKIHLTADCDIIPEFDVIGYVRNILPIGSEYIINVYIGSRTIEVGTNMHGLSVEIL